MEQTIEAFSPNNNFSMIGGANGGYRVKISNCVLKEDTAFETDTEAETRLIAECVMRYYANKEGDYTYTGAQRGQAPLRPFVTFLVENLVI